MINNSNRGDWTFGNTSFNVATNKSRLLFTLLLSSIYDFNKEKKRIRNYSEDEQKKIFEFWKMDSEYKILAKNNEKYAKDTVRKKIATLRSYGLIDSNSNLTFFGKLYLENFNDEENEISNLIKEKYSLSPQNISMICGSISIKSNSGYQPFLEMFKILKTKPISWKNFSASRYANSPEEYISILNMNEKDLYTYLLNYLIENGYEKICDGKSNHISADEIILSVKDELLLFKGSNEISDKKSQFNKIINKLNMKKNWKKAFETAVDNDFFNICENVEDAMWFGRYFNLWINKSYHQQLKILGVQSKVFNIDKNKNIIPSKKNDFLNFENPNLELENIEGIEKSLFFESVSIENESKQEKLIEMFKISNTNMILSDLLEEDFYENDIYPSEIRAHRKYVLLEYFIAILLSKKTKINFKNIFTNHLYEDGSPMSHAPGKTADLCIEDLNILVEVTTSIGRSTEILELEPVQRHLEQKITSSGKQYSTLFVASEPISPNIYSTFISQRNMQRFTPDGKEIDKKMLITTFSIKEFEKIISLSNDDTIKIIDEVTLLDNEESKKIANQNWNPKEYVEKRKRIIQY